MKKIIYLLILALCYPALANAMDRDDELNFLCLKKSYPQIESFETDAAGNIFAHLKNGQNILYAAASPEPGVISLRESLAQIYPLEPERPEIAPGFAPGRQRPYQLFAALYGADKREVARNLAIVKLGSRSASLHRDAAKALNNILPSLEAIRNDPSKKNLLKVDGGYYWRKIAGEDNLSAHSYGIALDLGADKAPYWRWSRARPHPMQKTYPGEIVSLMEQAGFIWGGKWDKYDLMHFEYRPELICKARLMRSTPGNE